MLVDGRQLRHALGVGIERRIGRVEPVYVAQHHQQVCIQGHGHVRRQAVVVAEHRLGGLLTLTPPVLDQLAHADTVVFVEDGNSSEFKQPHQGGAQTKRAVPIG